jgi:hypothetical protein
MSATGRMVERDQHEVHRARKCSKLLLDPLPLLRPGEKLASLYAVEAGRAERLAVDEEGCTKVTNSPTRFIAPAVGALALVGLSQGDLDYDTVSAEPEMAYGSPLSGSVAGLVGASITGLLLSSLSHPAAVTLGVLGVVRTTYPGVIGKGREVASPADTRIQVQLSPGSAKRTPSRERDPFRERSDDEHPDERSRLNGSRGADGDALVSVA